MSPIALKLLTLAYENYEKTSNKAFSYQFKNADDMFYSTEAAQQLYDDGYIENVSDFVFETSVSIFSGPICFDITSSGIKYMRSYRESQS